MIYYISGQPGHGKTIYTVSLGVDFIKEGRAVYSYGIPGEKRELTGFLPLEDPTRWDELPDGSVIILDECYTHFPKMPAGSKVPSHIEKMARHRHRGFDFVIISQKGDQIHDFIKGLIEEHRHVQRKFGGNRARIKVWDRFEPGAAKAKDYLTSRWFKYPKALYGYYKSATQHTMKWKMPWYFYVFPLLLIAAVFAFWRITHLYAKPEASAIVAPPGAAGADAHAQPLDRQQHDAEEGDELRHKDFAKWLKPRLAGQPWSAPAYDKLAPTTVPEIYCIAMDDGKCVCHTEQGTRDEVDVGICRAIAAGGSYNPFRRPLDSRNSRQDAPASAKPERAPRDEASAPVAVAMAPYQRGVGSAYTPPELTKVGAIGASD